MNPSLTAAVPALRTAARAALALLLAGAAASALSQYKVVAPDGSVTYTDRPPAGATTGKITNTTTNSTTNAATNATTTTTTTTSTTSPPASANLPPELRQAAARFPVALYATRPCVPCDQSRQWLRQRGIPFSEYSVDKPTDVTALKTRFGDTQMPVVTIGGQVIKGFSAAELQSYADAAGYPADNRLGAYTWPSAVPLAPPPQVVTAPAPPAPAPAPPPPPQPRTGIQF